MPDFKYDRLTHFGEHASRTEMLSVKSHSIHQVAHAFFQNVYRTDTFARFPARMGADGFRRRAWRDRAVLKVTGKLPDREPLYDKETETAIRTQVGLYEIESIQQMLQILSDSDHAAVVRKGELLAAVEHINDFAMWDRAVGDSMKALLYSVVVESWAAFETLVADLFFEALDHGPSKWRINVANRPKEFTGGSNWEPQKVAPVVVNDPQEKYGSFLRDGGFISFQRFRSIKSWYRTAFGEDVAKLFGEVEGGYIKALSAVRNIILHKGGVADATYKKEIEKFAELRDVKEGESIKLDGEIVRKLRNSAIALGGELIFYLDGILSPVESKP